MDLRFPAEELPVAFAIPVDWVILHWYACGAEGRAYAHVIIYAQWTKILTHGAPLRGRASPKMFVVNQDVKNAKIDLCHAAAILSQESSFFYAQLAL